MTRVYNVDDWMIMNVKQFVEWDMAGETEVLGKHSRLCNFVHHESYMARPEIETGPPQW
jgi:hypothetical protein